MHMQMFSVYDEKAKAYMTPFFCPNDQVAWRAFAHEVNHGDGMVRKYPKDFTLYKLGHFVDSSAEFVINQQVEFLVNGSSLADLPVKE